ncbi:uncharacterized protein EV154DRAFT_525945 [Mucor mucedo]|uniref:uncharacterized protein n=1 Tax=Mucor mucedo TaxID=29922 RepID=UPI00221F7D22|nr:uncharacterized protein EV154DRAFT_525945 [Mucor mucedo]KAI7876484.1 hypothetical protein EV154DRAFT_525945 [Mucor mucedo]
MYLDNKVILANQFWKSDIYIILLLGQTALSLTVSHSTPHTLMKEIAQMELCTVHILAGPRIIFFFKKPFRHFFF